MADLADIERRVIALEAAQMDNTKTLNWVVGTLGRVAADVSALSGKVDKVEADIAGLRRDLPGIVVDAVREAMKKP